MTARADTSTAENALPYRVTANDLLLAAETIRIHGPQFHALVSALKSKASYVRTALEMLGLVTEGSLQLSDLGLELAYAKKDGGTEETFLRIVRSHEPLALALTHFAASREEETPLSAVEAFWGKRRIGASDRNRTEGALFFAHMVAAAGLGDLVLGRGNNRSRIVWRRELAERLVAVAEPARAVEPDALGVKADERRPSPPAVASGDARVESFRLVTPSGGAGRLELPVDVRQADLVSLRAQIEAVFHLLRTRLGESD